MNPQEIILKSKNWKGFKKRLSKLDSKGKGDCFEVLTKAYLETDPRYSSKPRRHQGYTDQGEYRSNHHQYKWCSPQIDIHPD